MARVKLKYRKDVLINNKNWRKMMTKLQWHNHIREVSGKDHPTMDDVAIHHTDNPNCLLCLDRKQTRKKNASARARHAAYTASGMVRVKGALGGIYYE